MVDELLLSDRTPNELARSTGLETNLLAHHLGVLEEAGLIRRQVSSGDRRRRYISLDLDLVRGLLPEPGLAASSVIFVCTHNSARSQIAEALFRSRSSIDVQSAGSDPARSVHLKAKRVAAEMGVDLQGQSPKPYRAVAGSPDLVVSVCDRALEADIPFQARLLHWSIPDPVESGRIEDFRRSFDVINKRVGHLVDSIVRGDEES